MRLVKKSLPQNGESRKPIPAVGSNAGYLLSNQDTTFDRWTQSATGIITKRLGESGLSLRARAALGCAQIPSAICSGRKVR